MGAYSLRLYPFHVETSSMAAVFKFIEKFERNSKDRL
jgi:hypothetical protein